MMAAIMYPSVAPTVLMYDRLRSGHRARGRGAVPDATALFVLGYLLVWTLAGLAAYGVFEFVRAIDPPFLAWDEAGRYVAAGVIVAAAVYQATPLKQACLVKCRSPMMFLAERWRHGRWGGLELGARTARGASVAAGS
jgi:predicted metal-binding membrane protein